MLFALLCYCAFFATLFLQSGIDKIVDYKGNLDFYTEHFAASPLARFTKPMLTTLALLEVFCGILFLVSFLQEFVIFAFNRSMFSFHFSLYANALALLIFVMLFFGQRVSKDYKGAATIVVYFILALLGMKFFYI